MRTHQTLDNNKRVKSIKRNGKKRTFCIYFFHYFFDKNAVSFLSIPRDIWIESLRIKLNSAYYWGNERQENGGLILAKSSVEEIIGSPVHYAVVIDFVLFKDYGKKKILRVFTGIGLAVGIFLLYFIFRDGIISQIVNQSVSYNSPHLYLPLVLTLYVFATCISFLISSDKMINIIGIVMLTSFLAAGLFFSTTFISVWCFFAAVLSFIIFLYFYRRNKLESR